MRKYLPPEAAYWLACMAILKDRLDHTRKHPDKGMTSEMMVIIAAIVLVAITAMGILVAKIIAKANEIELGGGGGGG